MTPYYNHVFAYFEQLVLTNRKSQKKILVGGGDSKEKRVKISLQSPLAMCLSILLSALPKITTSKLSDLICMKLSIGCLLRQTNNSHLKLCSDAVFTVISKNSFH